MMLQRHAASPVFGIQHAITASEDRKINDRQPRDASRMKNSCSEMNGTQPPILDDPCTMIFRGQPMAEYWQTRAYLAERDRDFYREEVVRLLRILNEERERQVKAEAQQGTTP